jgi:hypothetical protein
LNIVGATAPGRIDVEMTTEYTLYIALRSIAEWSESRVEFVLFFNMTSMLMIKTMKKKTMRTRTMKAMVGNKKKRTTS